MPQRDPTRDSMRRCLFIAYYFPPGGGVGVQRSLKFTRFLPEHGWSPRVVTAVVPQGIPLDEALLEQVSDETEIHRVPPLFSTADLSNASRRLSLIRRIIRWALVPDAVVPWVLPAYRRGLQMIKCRDVELIYSTSPPHSSHLVGYLLKKRTGLPWVADFRDAWLTDPDRNRSLSTRVRLATVERLQEWLVVRNADRVIAVTEGIRDDLLDRFELEQVALIPNGYDPVDYPCEEDASGGVFTFTYTGSLLRANRDPQALFHAVRELLEGSPELRGRFRVLLVGPHDPADADRAGRREYGEAIQFVGEVSSEEAIRYQCRSDVNLFLYTGPGDGRERQMMSGKIFDYLGAGRPVLAIAPAESAAARLVTRLGVGVQVDPGGPAAIAEAMRALIVRGRNRRAEVAEDELVPYQRRTQSKQLAELFGTLIPGGSTQER